MSLNDAISVGLLYDGELPYIIGREQGEEAEGGQGEHFSGMRTGFQGK